jgi:uncharacterized protein (DUF433 family)
MPATTNGHHVPAAGLVPPESSPAEPSLTPPPSADPQALETWRQSLRDFYKPFDPLARFLLERLIDAACDLSSLRRDAPEPSRDDVPWTRRVRLAETSFTRAMTDWHRHTRFLQQSARSAQSAPAASAAAPACAPARPRKSAAPTPAGEPSAADPNALPRAFDKRDDIEIDTTPPINWEDHIVYDPKIDHLWPIIRGTTHRADGIAGMISYGWSYRYLLEHFDGITVDDLRAVIAADALEMCGPWPEGERPQPRPPETVVDSGGATAL